MAMAARAGTAAAAVGRADARGKEDTRLPRL